MTKQVQSNDASSRLAQINRAITTSLNFDKVLELIVENAVQLVNASAAALLLVGKDGLLRIRASQGLDLSVVGGFSGRMEEGVIKRLQKSLVTGDGQALVSLPIIAMNSLKGMLVITRESEINADEERQLSALADQAAIALRNARLHEMELEEAKRERNETLEALKESNDRITTILESISDLYYSLDCEWRFTYVNPQAELRLGKTRSELIDKVIWDVYPDAVHTIFHSNLHEAMNELVPVHFELPSQMLPGVWFEVHGYPTQDGLNVYLRDISERKRAEITNHLFAAIVESSDDAIISKDLNGVINSWNKGAERIFGYTAAEMIGRNITTLIPAGRHNEEPTILARIRSGKAVDHYETIRRRKDGTLIDISLTVSPMFDEAGQVIGASKIARDISERKRREKEIRFQADLLNAVEQAVIATDLSGKIVYWNHFAERLYGWSSEEALGANVLELVPAEGMRSEADSIFEQVGQGGSWSGEFIVRRKNGDAFPAVVTNSPIFDDQGQLIGVVGISIDVTERKRAEEERSRLLESEREARNEAEAANRLKDEFLATLSHELRNPLNVILGYSEVLLRSQEVKNSPFLNRAVEVLRRNALAQAQLVRDLLDLSRLHMGKLLLNLEAVSLTTTISNAVETVRKEALDKHIDIKVETPDDVIFVSADALRLEQIVWNLLNNAVKFTPAGGSVVVRFKRDGEWGVLQIEDNGQGIDPEFLPYVFEMFRQADATVSRKHGGMGIGLALVQQLVELHDGLVSVDSKGTGQGATFEVRIPLSSEGREAVNTLSVDAGVLKNLRILVVDDSADTVDMLERLFEMDGATVATAKSGKEALEIAAKKQFDVILSDISMPEMDGFELLRKLRALPGLAQVPVLALTGFGRTEDVQRAHSEGFFSHVTKPIDVGQLVEILQKIPVRA